METCQKIFYCRWDNMVHEEKEIIREARQKNSETKTHFCWDLTLVLSACLPEFKNVAVKTCETENLTILERYRALEACETISKKEFVMLGDKKCTEFKDIAAHFQVGKALISKIKNMSRAEKDKLRRKAKSLPKHSKTTRNQVLSALFPLPVIDSSMLSSCFFSSPLTSICLSVLYSSGFAL